MDSTAPPCKILIREPGSVSILREGVENGEARVRTEDKFNKLTCSFIRSSPDGSILALVSSADVALVSSATGDEICRFPATGVIAASFSPRGSFLLTFQKPDGKNRNLVLWNTKDGSSVWQQFQKTYSKADWPTLQFSDDEELAYRVVSGEVQFYEGAGAIGQASGPTGRLKAQGMGAAAVSPSPTSHCAAFFPSLKGAPASVRVYRTAGHLDNCSSGEASAGALAEPEPVARRSFFKATTVRMMWGGGAKGVLVWTHSDVDKTNQSYYGDSALHYLSTDGSFEGSVPLGKEGPIHDVQWAPSGKEFIVVHGYMPSKAILFDAKCKPLFDFGSGPRNMVRWNPHGHFILLAGFGNLPGDVEFWDREALKQLGSTRAACGVTAEWAPHGRTVLIATTAPRLQVDNGIRIFKYNGALLLHSPYKALYDAEWLPAPKDCFPDRPPSPKGSSGVAPIANPKPAAAPAYRPPGASASSSAVFRARMSGEADKPRHLGAAAPQSSEPGKLSKSAAKNQRRKQSKAASGGGSAAQSSAGDDVAANGGASGAQDVADGTPTDAGQVEVVNAQATGEKSSSSSSADAAEKEKKIRNLTKKIRQVEDLKLKDKSKLEKEQLEKIGQESALRAELAALQLQN